MKAATSTGNDTVPLAGCTRYVRGALDVNCALRSIVLLIQSSLFPLPPAK